MLKRALSLLLITILCLSLASCKSERVTGISLLSDKVILSEGETFTLVASVSPSYAKNKKVIWKSSDEDIARVHSGEVTAIKTGTVTITAESRDGGFSASCFVEVRDSALYVSKEFTQSTELFGIKYFSRICDALAASSDGDTIIVKSGVYDEVVNVSRSVTLVGENAKIAGCMVVGYPSLEKELSDVTIRSFSFSLNRAAPTGDLSSVVVGNKVKKVNISNCDFFGGEGKPLKNASAVTNTTSRLAGALSRLTLSDCTFFGFDSAIFFKPYAAQIIVERCAFDTCAFSLSLQGAQKTAFRENKLTNAGLINFIGAEVPTYDVKITDNDVTPYAINSVPQLLISAKRGDLDEGQKLRLYTNRFYGKKPNEMTSAEKNQILSLIDVGEEGEKAYDNVLLEKPPFLFFKRA